MRWHDEQFRLHQQMGELGQFVDMRKHLHVSEVCGFQDLSADFYLPVALHLIGKQGFLTKSSFGTISDM